MAKCMSCGSTAVPSAMRIIENKISGEQRFVCNERCMSQLSKIGWPVDTNKVTDRWRDIAFAPIVRELLARYPDLPRDLKIRYAPPTDAKHHPGPVNLADMFGVGDNHTLFLRAKNQEDALIQLQRMGLDAGTADRGFFVNAPSFMAGMAEVPQATAASFDAQMRIAIAEFGRRDRGEPSEFPILPAAVPAPATAPEKTMPPTKRPAVKKPKEEGKEARRRSPVPVPSPAPRPSTLVMVPTLPADATIADLRARKTALDQALQTRATHVHEDAGRRKAVHDEAMATYARLSAEYKAALARLEASRKVEEAQYAAVVERRIQEDERAVAQFNTAVAEIDERMRAIYERRSAAAAAAAASGEQDEQRRRDEEAAKRKRDEEEQREFDRMQEKRFEQQERRAEAKGLKREEKEAAEQRAMEEEKERRRKEENQRAEEAAQRRLATGMYTRDDLAIADYARPLTRDTFSWYDIPNRRPFSLKDPALIDSKQFRPFAIDQLFKIMTDCVLTRKSTSVDFEVERSLGKDIQREFDGIGTTKEKFVLAKIKDAKGSLGLYLDPMLDDGSVDEDVVRQVRDVMRSDQVPEHWKAFFREVKARYADKGEKIRDDALVLVFGKFWSYSRELSEDEFGASSESASVDEDDESRSDE